MPRGASQGRSPTPGLLIGLVLTLAAVAAYAHSIARQIASLRVLQSDLVDRNRRDSLQLLRAQNDLNQLGLAMRDKPLGYGFAAVAHEPALYAALTLYAGAALLWIWLLSRIPLSRAYPWVSVALAIVSLSSWYLFDERLGPMLWLGIALIAAGVVVIATAG